MKSFKYKSNYLNVHLDKTQLIVLFKVYYIVMMIICKKDMLQIIIIIVLYK